MIPRLFLPDHYQAMYAVLLIVGLVVVPLCAWLACHYFGRLCSRLLHPRHSNHPRRNWGNLAGLLLVSVIWYIIIYGVFVGYRQLEIRHVDLTFPDLPEAFDGYRLVLFSDAHVGTLSGSWQWLLQRDVDSINRQRADMIVFAGDLQNVHPKELYEHRALLSRLNARDGVWSVLGNHDYATYLDTDEAEKAANDRETVSLERQMGWHLLLNEHRVIERDGQRLVIAGMENYGAAARFPKRGDVGRALAGTAKGDFIIMLEHDPYAWRQQIVPDGRAQLTLSGHTHAMQFMLGQWSPISLTHAEWNGLYREGHQQLYVTAGMGALIPWRFGAPGEIVVITLRR